MNHNLLNLKIQDVVILDATYTHPVKVEIFDFTEEELYAEVGYPGASEVERAWVMTGRLSKETIKLEHTHE